MMIPRCVYRETHGDVNGYRYSKGPHCNSSPDSWTILMAVATINLYRNHAVYYYSNIFNATDTTVAILLLLDCRVNSALWSILGDEEE